MQKTCQGPNCGTIFEAKRATAKYCSRRCSVRTSRAPDRGSDSNVVQMPGAVEEGLISRATQGELASAGVLGTAFGQAAMVAARRLDSMGSGETGAGVKALLEAHRMALAEATKDAKQEADPLDEIRRSAALKLIARSG